MDRKEKKQLLESIDGGHYYIIKLTSPIAPPQRNGVTLGIYVSKTSFLYVDCKHVIRHIVSDEDVWNPNVDSIDMLGLVLTVEGDGSIKDSRNFASVDIDEFEDVIEIDKESFDDACNKYYIFYEKQSQLIEDVKKQMREDPAYKLDHYMLMADWRNFDSTGRQH